MAIDLDRFRQLATQSRALAKDLPITNPQRSALLNLAEKTDDMIDQIEALPPIMRDDLEAMFASVRPN